MRSKHKHSVVPVSSVFAICDHMNFSGRISHVANEEKKEDGAFINNF